MAERSVCIVTDSTCDLDQDVLQKHRIRMVPLNIHFGSETFKDRVDLLPTAFFKKLESKGAPPTTSQPSPREFQALYEKFLAEGMEVVSLHISSKMSGTWQSALLAKRELANERIHVVDSLTTSVGLGAIVLECAGAAEKGKSAPEILAVASHMIRNTRLLFVVDTLEYLQRGGRIGMAAAFIGGLLNIKPILELKDGVVFPLERVRGTRKAQNRFISLVGEYMEAHRGQEVRAAFAWSGDPQNLEAMFPEMNQHFDCRGALRMEIGAVVGAHVGPGTIGIALCAFPT